MVIQLTQVSTISKCFLTCMHFLTSQYILQPRKGVSSNYSLHISPHPPQGTAVGQWLWCCATNILPIQYIGCPRRNVPEFGRVFLMLKYTDITQNTYVQIWTVKEIMAREKCGLLVGPRTVPVSWQSYSCQSLSAVSYDSSSAHARLIPECVVSRVASPLGSHLSRIMIGTLRTTMTRVRVFL